MLFSRELLFFVLLPPLFAGNSLSSTHARPSAQPAYVPSRAMIPDEEPSCAATTCQCTASGNSVDEGPYAGVLDSSGIPSIGSGSTGCCQKTETPGPSLCVEAQKKSCEWDYGQTTLKIKYTGPDTIDRVIVEYRHSGAEFYELQATLTPITGGFEGSFTPRDHAEDAPTTAPCGKVLELHFKFQKQVGAGYITVAAATVNHTCNNCTSGTG